MKISVLTPSIRPRGLAIVQDCLQHQTFPKAEMEWLVEIGLPPTHDLNAAFNRMLKRAKGELIVFYQDYIRIERDGLQKFWDAYQEFPDAFFTAPVGKTVDWENKAWDWRHSRKELEVAAVEWEIDWGSAPREALFKIGGFDEELDKFWTFDNVNVATRAELAGYKFRNLQKNPAVGLDHDRLVPHPFRERINPEFHNSRLDFFRRGNRIDYLCS